MARIAMRIEQLARRPAQVVARSGRLALASELDRLLAGPIPETVARALVRHRVLERAVSEAMAASTLEEPGSVDRLVDRVVASPAFERAVADVLSSPQVRRAAGRQATGFGEEVAEALRCACARWDDTVEEHAHRFMRRPTVAARQARYAGIVSRALALTIDAALAQFAFLLGLASFALLVSLVGGAPQVWQAVGGTVLWSAVVAAYFVVFWSTTGQTPGMRLLQLRLVTARRRPPSPPRALLRLVLLLASVACLFLGFLPAVIDGRRRALPDLGAGTVVVRSPGRRGITRSG